MAPTVTPEPAQAEGDPYGRETPNGCFIGFLRAARSGDFGVAAEYLQLPRLRVTKDAVAREVAAVFDQRFVGNPDSLSHSPQGDIRDGLPPDEERAGAMLDGRQRIDVLLVRSAEKEGEPLWLISSATVSEARRLYPELASSAFEKRLPPVLVSTHVFALRLWQAIAVLLLLPALYLVSWFLVALSVRLLRWRRVRLEEPEALWTYAARRPATAMLTLIFHRIAIFFVGVPLLYRLYYNRALFLFLLVGSGWLVLRILDTAGWGLAQKLLPAAGASASAGALFRLARRVLKAILVLVIVFLALGVLGWNPTPTLAGIGLGGLALAFAAQKSLENVFGGVALLGSRVVRVGDTFRIGSYTGVIEDVTLFATRLRTNERTVVHIPNGVLTTERIENLSLRDRFWFHHTLGLRRETTAAQMSAVLDKLRAAIAEEPAMEPGSRVRLRKVTESSLDVEVHAYVRATNEAAFLEIQGGLLLALLKAIEGAGADLAVPSQRTYGVRDRVLAGEDAPEKTG